MREGLLWYDNDPGRRLPDKVKRAATRYQARFGQKPTMCYVNLAEFDDQFEEVNGIRLRPVPNILRHHFWLGVEVEAALAKAG